MLRCGTASPSGANGPPKRPSALQGNPVRYPTLTTTAETALPPISLPSLGPDLSGPDPNAPDPNDPDPAYAVEDALADVASDARALAKAGGPPREPPRGPVGPGGYDTDAVAASAQALSTQAHEAFVSPVLKLIGRRRRAGVFALGALAVGAVEATVAPWIDPESWAAVWEWVTGVLASVLGLAAAGSFAHALVDRASAHHAHDRKWRAYNHDFGALRTEAADRFRMLDRVATARGLRDFAARSHGLRLLNRKLKVECAVMEERVGRFFRLALLGFWALAVVGCAGAAAGLIAQGGAGWAQELIAVGVFAVALAEAALILHFGRRQIEGLVAFLAPPPDDPDPFVVIAVRVDELITQVIAQNEFLRGH
jgi:hypothetical protein